MHESQLHEFNCFVTLTFNDDNLSPDLSLHPEDLTLFLKRLRKHFSYHYNQKLRYFACGEYGALNARPHYHAILFGCDFPDKVPWKQGTAGSVLYRSKTLEDLWPYGYSSIGSVTYQSAGYVSRYCLKKVTGKAAADYYGHRKPPYIVMSRRPGIAAEWFKKYYRDVYPHDYCVDSNGYKRKPPRYYDAMYDYMMAYVDDFSDFPTLEELKKERVKKAMDLLSKEFPDERNPLHSVSRYRRLEDKEQIKIRAVEKLRRDL